MSTRFIEIESGLFVPVDEADFEILSRYTWRLAPWGRYALRRSSGVTTLMHRAILGVTRGIFVDHINGDGLDNRRSNLRIATVTQNCQNRRRRSDARSRFKGLLFKGGRWIASIKVNKVYHYLGIFTSEEAAARAYDAAAQRHFGTFARLNFQSKE